MALILGFTLAAWLTCVISFVLLVIASWCVGEGGEILGAKYDASIIGGLLIAWLNTSPEAIFFVTALRGRAPRFAIGAMSGSAIVVSTVALGTILFLGTASRRNKGGSFELQPGVKGQCLWLLVSCVLPVLAAFAGFTTFAAAAGIATYVAFVLSELTRSKQAPSHQHSHRHDEETPAVPAPLGPADADEATSSEEELRPTATGIAYLIAGGALILTFAEPFISGVSELAADFGVNPILLAFFLAPVASEMPEILESISLSRKGKTQSINVAFSNLVGGTVTKTTLLVGLFNYYGITSSFAWEMPNYPLSLGLMAVCAALAAVFGRFFAQQRGWMAYILFSSFFAAGVVQYLANGTTLLGAASLGLS